MLTTKAKVKEKIETEIQVWKEMLDQWPEVSSVDPTSELVRRQRIDLTARISALQALERHLFQERV